MISKICTYVNVDTTNKKNIAINIREIYFMDCIQNFFIFLIDKYNVQSYNKKHQQ